jgi:hypothetical protein
MLHELRRKGTGERVAHLFERPPYCDRGRWHANIDVGGFHKSDADPWPRYYFNLPFAKLEVLAYLEAKKVNTENTEWVEVP